jgi:hypothetical protein
MEVHRDPRDEKATPISLKNRLEGIVFKEMPDDLLVDAGPLVKRKRRPVW